MDRFSLLLLEPSEIYFEDFKVVYHTRPEDKTPAVHNEIPGRLKVPPTPCFITSQSVHIAESVLGVFQERGVRPTKPQFANAQVPPG